MASAKEAQTYAWLIFAANMICAARTGCPKRTKRCAQWHWATLMRMMAAMSQRLRGGRLVLVMPNNGGAELVVKVFRKRARTCIMRCPPAQKGTEEYYRGTVRG